MNGGLRNSGKGEWIEWWRSLAIAPEALTPRQRSWFVAAWTAVAVSRLLFPAASAWDWDEMLFSLGVRHFDVMSHHPHPPGFPLFIGMAKLLVACGVPVFRALQAIDLAGGILLVPAMFAFCRELRFRYSTSLIAALFLAFFPNVWFFGETAFSDVPAVVLGVGACALLLRGARDNVALMAGAIVLGAAAAFRPQNLAIGFVPALIATWYAFRGRRWATLLTSCLAGAAIIAASYGAAIAATGWDRYNEAVREHRHYITTVDSFRNPNRPPLLHLFDDFFIHPYHAPLVNALVTALAGISLVVTIAALVARRRSANGTARWGILIALASFGPFCLVAWLMLDHFSASRFSIGYAPLIALLAADGSMLVSSAAPERRRSAVERGIAAALTVAMAAWTVPALTLTRLRISPPARAMSWIRSHVQPHGPAVFVNEKVGPYAEWFLSDYKLEVMSDGPPVATLDGAAHWYVAEGTSSAAGARNFTWPHGRAWNVARRRYFEVSVSRFATAPQFHGDWYDQESDGRSSWRWLGRRGVIELPPISGRARLDLRIFAPLHVLHGRPVITIRMNGEVVKRFALAQPFFDLTLDFAHGAPALVEVETDRIVNPHREKLSGDTRDLGIRIDRLHWIAMAD